MQTAKEAPTVKQVYSTSNWRALGAGAVACAAMFAIAYTIFVGYRDHRWSIAAQQQAQDFVYASPVLSGNIGPITAVRGSSEVHSKSTPPTYDVNLHVVGQKGDGTVEVVMTRQGPNEWLVSSARLERGNRSISLL